MNGRQLQGRSATGQAVWLAALLLLAADRSPAAAGQPVLVASNGIVSCPASAAIAAFLGATQALPRARYDFGLPAPPPARRWREADTPILHTLWETGGVKYTQKVLVTRLERGDPPRSASAPEAVLMVQIFGECVAPEYTNATAAFAVTTGERALPLELQGDRILLVGGKAPVLLGVVDVAGSGIAATNGLRLRFQGHMPPGTTGAMTLKLPQRALANEAELDQLRDLDFEEELLRVKKFWKDHAGPPPVVWAEEAQP